MKRSLWALGEDRVIFKSWVIRLLLLVIAIVAIASYSMYQIDHSANAGILVEAEKLPTHTVGRGDLSVTVIEQGGLESSENTEVKCRVRGKNTVNWVIENGTHVEEGDVLVQLDTLAIEDAINERSKYAFWSQSGAERSKALVERSKLAIDEYIKGRYVSQLMRLEMSLASAEANVVTSKSDRDHSRKLQSKGYSNTLRVKEIEVRLAQAELEVQGKKDEIEVLKKYTKAMELKTLEGNLKAAEADHAANQERAVLDAKRRDLAKLEYELCVIKSEKSGMVIFPSAA
ncbi:HlyD family secretion protein, partial [bacterium]|nr:HlyD family secretion protein [bacterium]